MNIDPEIAGVNVVVLTVIWKPPIDPVEATAVKLVAVGLEIEPGSKLPIDANFVRLVFFTAYSIGLNLSQKLKKTQTTPTVSK